MPSIPRKTYTEPPFMSAKAKASACMPINGLQGVAVPAINAMSFARCGGRVKTLGMFVSWKRIMSKRRSIWSPYTDK